MGTWNHQSDLSAQFSERPLKALSESSPVGTDCKKGRERTALSEPEGTNPHDGIFRSLIASERKLTPRNHLATLTSVIIQVSLMIALAVIPLFHIDPLPKRERVTVVHLDAPVPAMPKVAQASSPKVVLTHAPARTAIPAPVHASQEASQHQLDIPAAPPGETGVPWGDVSGKPTGGAASEPLPAKAPDPAPVKRIRVAAQVAEANLIHEVPPVYPPEAGRDRIQGAVVLIAVIGTDGTVKDVQVESGPPLLVEAAIEAVKQWRYKPYLLNGDPVEINSRITINFNVSRG